MDRRSFLIRTTGGFAALSVPLLRPHQALAMRSARGGIPQQGAGLDAGQWRTLGAVQDHLFPSEPNAPGARDVDALGWLYFVLSDPDYDPADRAFIRSGLLLLETVARQEAVAPFPELAEPERERILRQLEQSGDGRRWLALILEYIFEALLTDPVYGANPGGIGWEWLDHRPGFARPTRDKRYFLL